MRDPAPLPVSEAKPAPVPTTERVVLLDVLRGVAVFGIFVANLIGFSGWWWRTPEQRLGTALPDWNAPVEFFVHHMLVDGKFYTIFSLLFGIGFAIQFERAGNQGASFAPLFRRRLLVLLAIGLMHLVLVWPGDILTLYAVMGFFVLPFRGRSDRAVLAWAVGLVLLPIAMYATMVASGGAFHWGAPFDALGAAALGVVAGTDAAAASGPSLYHIIETGPAAQVVGSNVIGSMFRWSDLMYSGRPAKVLAMFLVGFWAGRRKLHQDVALHVPLLRHVVAAGLIVGLPLNYLLAWYMEQNVYYPPSAGGLVQTAIYAAAVAPLGLAYAAGVALLWESGRLRGLLGAFAPVGRMALSNYLFQTAVGIGLLYGVGLGWATAVGPALTLPIAAGVFMFQIGASAWWLRRYSHGPVEWLWRRMTYGRPIPIRIAPPAPTVA